MTKINKVTPVKEISRLYQVNKHKKQRQQQQKKSKNNKDFYQDLIEINSIREKEPDQNTYSRPALEKNNTTEELIKTISRNIIRFIKLIYHIYIEEHTLEREDKVSNTFYKLSLKAINSSFKEIKDDYNKIDDNQLKLIIDQTRITILEELKQLFKINNDQIDSKLSEDITTKKTIQQINNFIKNTFLIKLKSKS